MSYRALMFTILALSQCWPTFANSQPSTTFRISDLDLRDPHFYASIPFFGCNDITDVVPLQLSLPVNETIQTYLQTDTDSDGYLDVSTVFMFTPLDQAGAGGTMKFGKAVCTAPLGGTACEPDAVLPPTVYTYSNMPAGTCLAPFAGTTYGPYTPEIVSPSAPCFIADLGNVDLDLGFVTLPLTRVHIAATYVGTPATSLASGLIRGFISEAVASTIFLNNGMGPEPLNSFLPGGAGNCAGHSDKDTVEGVVGWWFYFNFVADEVPYTEPPTSVSQTPGWTLVLGAAYPNPFNPSTSLRYSLEQAGFVRVSIYDANGRFVTDLVGGEQARGDHVVEWNGRGANGAVAASGIYFVRLESRGEVRTQKIVLLK